MVFNLLGKNINNKWNLLGYSNSNQINIPLDIKNLKIKIINFIILPLQSNQWTIIKNNSFLFELFKQKIDYYYNIYKLEELILYKDLLQICEILIDQNNQLNEIEQKFYKTKENSISLIYKTSMIKLKPEYELYDNIIGKPNKSKNQKYNEYIIKDIQNCMIRTSITYEDIKEFIEFKYKEI